MTDYKLMPKQITEEMADAFWEEYSKSRTDDLLMRCYRAMYAVAPQPVEPDVSAQVDALKLLMKGYENLLEGGIDRITYLNGDCYLISDMLQSAEKALATYRS